MDRMQGPIEKLSSTEVVRVLGTGPYSCCPSASIMKKLKPSAGSTKVRKKAKKRQSEGTRSPTPSSRTLGVTVRHRSPCHFFLHESPQTEDTDFHRRPKGPEENVPPLLNVLISSTLRPTPTLPARVKRRCLCFSSEKAEDHVGGGSSMTMVKLTSRGAHHVFSALASRPGSAESSNLVPFADNTRKVLRKETAEAAVKDYRNQVQEHDAVIHPSLGPGNSCPDQEVKSCRSLGHRLSPVHP
ncbi:hypothetical protein GWK47_004766 [Chionoecetes opilio]|uniref:Uncharacterized protein n=1 Tax=Chionoecetes opilio TaxID=41210 RepID=A0A8J5D1H6_CHIOP|nr:hypothetical protein GWK47_004766 [Chionoecetes opilio]